MRGDRVIYFKGRMLIKITCLIIGLFFLCLLSKTKCYAKEEENSFPGSLYAQSAVLMDGSSGRVLYEKNGQEFMANASTTKILTCILALEHAQLTDVVEVSYYAASMPDVQLHIREGEQYYMRDLLYSLMLESHNDVAVAIAEHISGSQEEFSKLMNLKAEEIGCKNTMFLTPNGLDAVVKMKASEKEQKEKNEELSVSQNTSDKEQQATEISHGTTAEDLALIMRYCIKLSPKKEQFLQITQTPEYSFTNIEGTRNFYCRNHNAFLQMMEGAISGKTGFTGKAGYCYVGALEREGKCYIVALLACGWPGNKNYKWSDCRKLMEYGLKNYQVFSLDELETSYINELTATVENGKRDEIGEAATIPLVRKKGAISQILIKEEEKATVQIIRNKLEAPVEKNQEAGVLIYYINNEKWMEESLVCKENVGKIDYKWCLKRIMTKILN